MQSFEGGSDGERRLTNHQLHELNDAYDIKPDIPASSEEIAFKNYLGVVRSLIEGVNYFKAIKESEAPTPHRQFLSRAVACYRPRLDHLSLANTLGEAKYADSMWFKQHENRFKRELEQVSGLVLNKEKSTREALLEFDNHLETLYKTSRLRAEVAALGVGLAHIETLPPRDAYDSALELRLHKYVLDIDSLLESEDLLSGRKTIGDPELRIAASNISFAAHKKLLDAHTKAPGDLLESILKRGTERN